MAESVRSPRKIARRFRQLPSAIRNIRNWPLFIVCYAFALVPRTAYLLRNGVRLKIARAVDHAVVVEVVFNEEYGTPCDERTIVDIGASNGVFTLCAAATARQARIYAYEPSTGYYSALIDNIKRNGIASRVEAFNFAVGSDHYGRRLLLEGGRFFFPSIVESGRGAAAGMVVPSTTLPEIMNAHGIDRIDLLKMDCEGAEYEVLYATSPEQLQRISRLRMEYHNLDGLRQHVGSLSTYLVDNGFRIVRAIANTTANGMLWAERRGLS
jgi:FkbM family methyltransferase